jgi:hydroxymethylbilane synthase
MVSTKKRSKSKKISIGTRGSKLALWQAEWIKSELHNLHPTLDIELIKIKTTGDKILDVPLAKVGGKGLFVKEIEEALLRRKVDIAVHSMKDVPTDFPEGLHLPVMCRREDPRDAFLSQIQDAKFKIKKFADIPKGAIVGTSSLRRSSQLLNLRPDVKIEQLRGNLDTRIRRLDEKRFDAIILALAGVKRLGLTHRVTEILPVHLSLPAIGQGAIGIECRVDDGLIHSILEPLNHIETFICVSAERSFLRRLEGGCQVPIAAHARIEKDTLVMDGLVGSVTGDRIIRGHIDGKPEDAEKLGYSLANDVLARGAKDILDEVYGRDISTIQKEKTH